MIRRFNPTQLQGNLEKNNYFEGWFQKIYSPEHDTSFIIIYGFATGNKSEKTGFIQICLPNQEIIYLTFHKNEVICDKRKHFIQFGNHFISEHKIKIQTDEIQLDLDFSKKQEQQSGKNTMGNYYLLPNLPCYHAIVDGYHSVNGQIQYLNDSYTFTNAVGYLEKNWGISFPEKYIWMHAFDAKNTDNQLLFSQADIKWNGRTFIKHLGFIKLNGIYFDLRKLKKCKTAISNKDENKQFISIKSKFLEIEMNISYKKPIFFKGPQNGKMERIIEHYNDIILEGKVLHKSSKTKLLLTGNMENINY